jgi:hypothetical protein
MPVVAAVGDDSLIHRIIWACRCGIQIDPEDGARLAKAILVPPMRSRGVGLQRSTRARRALLAFDRHRWIQHDLRG